jgi:hypothetical protein
MSNRFEVLDDIYNPLEIVEEVLNNQDWVFDRTCDNEIKVHISGESSQYTITFIWHEDQGALQLCCDCNISIPQEHLENSLLAVRNVNNGVHIGHFAIADKTNSPCFFYTSLLKGCAYLSGGVYFANLIEIALTECERYNTLFTLLATPTGIMNDNNMSLAMMETAGAA